MTQEVEVVAVSGVWESGNFVHNFLLPERIQSGCNFIAV